MTTPHPIMLAAPFMILFGCWCLASPKQIPDMLKLRDSKGGNPDEWPEEYRMRELPTPRRVGANDFEASKDEPEGFTR
jgi:hypothetical protein